MKLDPRQKERRHSRADDFFNSVENQKKYGFTVDYRDGIRSIYYDGDFNVLIEAAYGKPVEYSSPDIEPDRLMKLTLTDGKLQTQLPDSDVKIPVHLEIGEADTDEPNFEICAANYEQALCCLSLVAPEYYPDETSCQYLLDMQGLTALNSYLRDNYKYLVESWNSKHPCNPIPPSQPIPNYRYLGSPAYMQRRKKPGDK